MRRAVKHAWIAVISAPVILASIVAVYVLGVDRNASRGRQHRTH